MTGAKTNERPGTRARASYVRSSPYKARAVLDQIRGKSYAEALEILAFSERDVAVPIRKVVDSAAANAEHNDGLDADELYVSACYADEGPTLKRWRPRARGRATQILKRSCHITVILSRYEAEALEEFRARAAAGPGRSASEAEARRRRVARSRQASGDQEPSDDEAGEKPSSAAEESSGDEESSGGEQAVGGEAVEKPSSGDEQAVGEESSAAEQTSGGEQAASEQSSGGEQAGGEESSDNEAREA